MFQAFLSTIYQVFFPIAIPVAGGALLKRYRGLDTKTVSSFALHILSPALIFDTLAKAELSLDDVYKTVLFCVINLLLLWGIAVVAGKWFKLSSEERAGLTLVATFTNSVNYGLPLVILAFGQLGLDKASVYVIAQMIIVNTIGVYFAARSHFSVKAAVKSVFSLPAIYAAAVASALRISGLELPDALDKGISMVADAYAPVVLAILGAQMVQARSSPTSAGIHKAFWAGFTIRTVLSPLIAAAILYVMSVQGILFSVIVILSSMPAAVNAVILAEQFNAAPRFVSKCILWTTLVSFFVLPFIVVAVS